jgi:hypothetical protein
VSEERLAVLDQLALDISASDDPEEKAELERTLVICREIAYALTEGIIKAEFDPDGDLRFASADAYVEA